MKAIIMAGGEGSRLRPLTCDCPKPMLPLMGKPLMEYTIHLLQKHGIREIGTTLAYLPDVIIDYFGDGKAFGVHLHYYIEKNPMGTAGSVKQAHSFLNEGFIVLSGDGITDFDLSAALRFHAQKGALATILLKKSAHPQEYGLVVTQPDGRIRSFHEKPGRSDVFSDLINTGIYILEPEILNHIPENTSYDFGHDLFPALVRQGLPLYGYTAEGYWCDVGNVNAYLQVHADALDHRIHLPGLESAADYNIKGDFAIEPPVYIAPGAQICEGARIGAYSIISDDCRVEPGASLKRSILFPGAQIGANAQLRGCIAGTNVRIGEAAQFFEESVVGSASQVGDRATLPPGVKIWPGKALPGGERPDANIVWGSCREQRFIAGALDVEFPAQAARAAEAIAANLHPREILIGRGTSTVAGALWHAAVSGAMAQGTQVLDAGVCTLPQLRYALHTLHADAAMLVEESTLTPLNATGVQLSERSQRDILKLMERQDFSAPFHKPVPSLSPAGCSDAAYVADVAAIFDADPAFAPKIIFCAPMHLTELAHQAFRRAGIDARCEYEADNLRPRFGELSIQFSPDGETACISDEHGPLDEIQRQLACAWIALENHESRLLLPMHATRSIDALAERYNAATAYIPGETAVWMNKLAEKSPLQFQIHFDALRFTLHFLSFLMKKDLTLQQWRTQMPAACRSTRNVQIPSSEGGRLLHVLAQKIPEAEMGGGIRLPRGKSWAWLGPDDTGAQLNIIAESNDMETAQELCDFYDGEIRRLLNEKQD